MQTYKYKKIYEEKTGFKIPVNWHIHHIDLDRENNDVDNLIALPKEVHQKYHFYLTSISVPTTKNKIFLDVSFNLNTFYFSRQDYFNLIDIIYDSTIYLDLKNFLIQINNENSYKELYYFLLSFLGHGFQTFDLFKKLYFKKEIIFNTFDYENCVKDFANHIMKLKIGEK